MLQIVQITMVYTTKVNFNNSELSADTCQSQCLLCNTTNYQAWNRESHLTNCRRNIISKVKSTSTKNKQNQTQMTMNESTTTLLVLITCLIAGLVVGILIGFGMQITVPPTDMETDDMETTYQPRIVELEGYDIDIAEYVDADTGIEYLIAIGPIGLAMCPRL